MDLSVNGQVHAVPAEAVDPAMPLLWVLRDVLNLTGTKFGCGVAACGACTVHLGADAVRSCVTPMSAVGSRPVTTIEALGRPDAPHPLQQAWVTHQVPQCGYCQSGMLMAAAALLQRNRRPSDADIDAAITNLCRCGTYPRVRAAIQTAAALLRGEVPRAPGTAAAPKPGPRPAVKKNVVARGCQGGPDRGHMKRRAWLLSGLAAGGALLVGWSVLPPRSRQGSAGLLPPTEGSVALNGWIKIAQNGDVLLAMNRSEMGQGVHTALAMLVAEELDVPLTRVRLIPAGHDALYGNVSAFVGSLLPLHPRDSEPGAETATVRVGQWMVAKVARELGINMTGGSSSVADAWEVLRLAAATARAQLLGAASLEWKLPVAEFSVSAGVISHPSGQRAPYQTFARLAPITPPGEVTLKRAADWRLIGTAAPRTDTVVKSNGRAVFGIDERQPGQLFAVVRHAPMLEGEPGRVDADAALRLPGVERVVRLGRYGGSQAAMAVVGRSHWHARRGADALVIDWRAPPAGTANSARILLALEGHARHAALNDGGVAFHRRGDVDSPAAAGVHNVEAIYRAPYLAHAAMEPVNAMARVRDGRVEVWVSTQVPGLARALAARVAGVPESAVTVNVSYLGGGFGRRLDAEVVGQVVRIAMECGGRPVQLVWTREEDMTHDNYRPAGVAVMQAQLDERGQPLAVRFTTAGDAISPRWMERNLPALAGAVDAPDKTTSEGLFDSPYEFPNQRIAHTATLSGVPVGFWRSVGHSHNAFFKECFIDELAAEARQDPVAFRMGWLRGMPRHAAVLKLAADQAGWPGFQGGAKPLAAGRARGVALHESFGSIVAQVAEVSLVNGVPRVHRVVVAADVGTVVNPGIVAQQMEGAVIFGLSAALYGRIDIVEGVVQQANFPSYRLLSLAETPEIETHLLASDRPPSGVGEPGTPPIAPAVANALFVLTGRRSRDLPLVATLAGKPPTTLA